MTPAEMLDAAMDGTLDVDGGAEHVDKPSDEENQGQQAEQAEQATAGEGLPSDGAEVQEPEGAPIASKSGAYTIPYQKLVDARTDRDAWKQRAEQLEAQVQSLSTQQQANLASAQQDAQNPPMPGRRPRRQTKTSRSRRLPSMPVWMCRSLVTSRKKRWPQASRR